MHKLYALYFIGRKTECFCIALLDVNFRLIRAFFTPGDSGAEINIDSSDIVLKATRDGASYVCIAHNHPSGNVTPSFDDIEMTRKLFEALASVGVKLLDHVIFYEYGVFSFHNNGILQKFNDDVLKKSENRLMEHPEERQLFLFQLNEYFIEPSKFITDKIVTTSKKDLIAGLKRANKKHDDDFF